MSHEPMRRVDHVTMQQCCSDENINCFQEYQNICMSDLRVGWHNTMTIPTCDCKAVPMKKTFAQKVLEHRWHSSYLHSQRTDD